MATGTNVFISYASDTKPLAEELTRALESQGIEPWVDFKDLQPGQRRREELEVPSTQRSGSSFSSALRVALLRGRRLSGVPPSLAAGQTPKRRCFQSSLGRAMRHLSFGIGFLSE